MTRRLLILFISLLNVSALYANELEVWVGGPVLLVKDENDFLGLLAQNPPRWKNHRKHVARLYFKESDVATVPKGAKSDKSMCHTLDEDKLLYLDIPDGHELGFSSTTPWTSSVPPARATSCSVLPDPSNPPPATCADGEPEREADAKWILNFDDVLRNSKHTREALRDDLLASSRTAARVKFDSGEISSGAPFECKGGYWHLRFDGSQSPPEPRAASEFVVVKLISQDSGEIALRWRKSGATSAESILKFKKEAEEAKRVFVVLDLDEKGLAKAECHAANNDHVFLEQWLKSGSKLRMPTGVPPDGCVQADTPRSNCSPVALW